MPITDLSKVFTMLFTAPTEAVVTAAAKQRAVWMDWLRDVKRLLEGAGDAYKQGIIDRHLALAPVWKMDAQVSVAVQMRVASIDRVSGGLTLGLGVSVLQAAGTFGFMSESSSESVLQARAQYAFSNGAQVSLKDYLSTLGIELKPDTLDTAIGKLQATSTPLPELPAAPAGGGN
jgi:hypothetical protein